jgi:hypothetical protein
MQITPGAARTDMCEQGSTVLCERPDSVRQPLSAEIVFWSMGLAALALLAILVIRRFDRRREVRPPNK